MISPDYAVVPSSATPDSPPSASPDVWVGPGHTRDHASDEPKPKGVRTQESLRWGTLHAHPQQVRHPREQPQGGVRPASADARVPDTAQWVAKPSHGGQHPGDIRHPSVEEARAAPVRQQWGHPANAPFQDGQLQGLARRPSAEGLHAPGSQPWGWAPSRGEHHQGNALRQGAEGLRASGNQQWVSVANAPSQEQRYYSQQYLEEVPPQEVRYYAHPSAAVAPRDSQQQQQQYYYQHPSAGDVQQHLSAGGVQQQPSSAIASGHDWQAPRSPSPQQGMVRIKEEMGAGHAIALSPSHTATQNKWDTDAASRDPKTQADLEKEKPYACFLCAYRTSQKAHLKNHIRVHTGEKPFSCSHCEYRCYTKSDLGKHLRVHTGERPFHCQECDFKATTKSDLTRHILVHTGEKPFKCEYCDFRANQKSNLTRHLRAHTGEKPFACPYCDFGANQKSDLTRHVRVHTGEKPFECEICSYRTGDKSALNRHMRGVHKIEPDL